MRWFWKAQAYEKLSSIDTTEDNESASQQRSGSTRLLRRSLAHFNVGFLVFNILFLYITLSTTTRIRSPNWLLNQTNTHTPLLDRFTFSLKPKTPNASLFNHPYSVYKGEPSSEVDAAWEAISDTLVFAITKEDVQKMGKDIDYAVGVPEEFGYGKDRYFAANDGQHLIHCLDELRKYAHYDYYYYPKYGPSNNSSALPAMHVAHRSHCVGVLLNALTCQPSLNMVTYEWMEDQNAPWPDFDVTRKCVDHKSFFDWQVREQIPRKMIKEWGWERPREKKARPILEELRKIQEASEHAGVQEHAHHNGHLS